MYDQALRRADSGVDRVENLLRLCRKCSQEVRQRFHAVTELAKLPNHFGRANSFGFGSPGWAQFLISHTIMQDLPNDTAMRWAMAQMAAVYFKPCRSRWNTTSKTPPWFS